MDGKTEITLFFNINLIIECMKKDFLNPGQFYTSPRLFQMELRAKGELLAGSAQVDGSAIDSWTTGNEDWFTM